MTEAEYREAAAECRRTASKQKTVEMKEAWLMMADAYERVASQQILPVEQPQASHYPEMSEQEARRSALD